MVLRVWGTLLRRSQIIFSRRWHGPLLALAGLGATLVYGGVLNDSQPLRTWLIWDYLRLWMWSGFLCAGCLSFGHLLIVKAGRFSFPVIETAVMSMAVGIIAFVLGMYLGGALHLYGPAFAIGLPAVMLVAGLPLAVPAVRDALARARAERTPMSPLALLPVAFGVLSFGVLYMQCATPEAISYDAAWSHLVIAEDYAREHRLVPFIAETAKNLPHLSSILYTWGFLVPGFYAAPLRWMMAQHIELLLFVWTLVGISAAARWMLDDTRASGSWAAYFLFPGFFVYDATLGAGSDHVAAFFAIPLLLTSFRAAKAFSPRLCVMAGLFGGAALHTKIQCVYLLLPIAALLAVRWGTLVIRAVPRPGGLDEELDHPADLWRGPLFFVAGVLLGFGPHLVMNAVFYRNPVYPLALRVFTGSTPRFTNLQFDAMEAAVSPGRLLQNIPSSLGLMFTFPFDAQFSFAHKMPLFGPLFSLMVPIVLLHARRRRLLLGLVAALGSVLSWAIIYRIERNLQVLLPWLVAVTAAAIAATWRSGPWARVGLLPLIFLQVAWGGKFIVAGGADRVRDSIEVIRGDIDRPGAPRYKEYRRGFREIGAALPHDAVLLLHTAHLQLGINRRTMSDWAGWQFAIDYRTMRTPRDVYLRFRELGITHILWNNYDFPSLKQEDVLFFAFTRRYAVAMPSFGGFSLWKLPDEPPPAQAPLQVLSLGLQGYGDGLYSIDKLNVFEDLPPERKVFPGPDAPAGNGALVLAGLKRADAVLMVRNFGLDGPSSDELARCFHDEHDYYAGYGISGYAVYLRKRGAPGCIDPAP